MYDGDDVVLVFDDSSSLTNRYLHGDAVDQVFADDSISEILWALADNQGTVRDVVNYDRVYDNSNVANHREFDAFGNITAESDGNVEFRYAYTGRFFDVDSEIQYSRARWLDLRTSRFLSEDPIKDDINLTRYVFNSPANYTDPSGLAAEDPYNLSWNTGAQQYAEWFAAMYVDPRTYKVENPVDPTDEFLWRANGFFGGWADKLTFGWSTEYREQENGQFANNSGPEFESGQTLGNWHLGTTAAVGGVMLYIAGPAMLAYGNAYAPWAVKVAGSKGAWALGAELYVGYNTDWDPAAMATAGHMGYTMAPGPFPTMPAAKKGLPPIKPGAANGPTAGKAFPKTVKDAAKAENPSATCVYCGTKGTATQVDHAIPKAKNGDATLQNAQLACPHCNASKGSSEYPKTPPPGYVGPWPPLHW